MNNLHKALRLVTLLALLVGMMLAAALIGPAQIHLPHVGQILLAQFHLSNDNPTYPLWMADVLLHVRLPRILVAACVGAALAISGCVMQSLFRNPLASPSILGVSSGASLGAVVALYLGLAALNIWLLPLFAFAGAGLTLLLVYLIAVRGGTTQLTSLLLAGIAISALNGALSATILAMSLDNWQVSRMIVFWSMGGLDARTWDHVSLILPITLLGLVILWSNTHALDSLLLGEVQALSLGVDVAKVRLQLLMVTAVLVGSAVSVGGGIAFVGLLVPHIFRLLMGPHHKYLLPAAALGGALFLVLADLILRRFFYDKNIPLGVITAAFGAPFFLYLLLKQRRQGL